MIIFVGRGDPLRQDGIIQCRLIQTKYIGIFAGVDSFARVIVNRLDTHPFRTQRRVPRMRTQTPGHHLAKRGEEIEHRVRYDQIEECPRKNGERSLPMMVV